MTVPRGTPPGVEQSAALQEDQLRRIAALERASTSGSGGGPVVIPDPLLLSNGTAAAPTYSFASDPDTGMYLPAANQLGFTAGGVELLRVGSADVDVMTGHLNLISNTGAQTMSLGEWSAGYDYAAVETPSMVVLMGNASDVNSQGFMRTKGTGSLNLGTNNSNDLTIANGGAVSTVGDITAGGDIITAVGSAAAPSHTFTGDTDTGMYRDGADSISITTGGVQRLDIDGGGIKGKVVFAAPYGSAAAPGFSFDGDTDTGMYRQGSNEIGFATGGTENLRLTGSNLRMASATSVIYNTGYFRGVDATGTASNPTFSWDGDNQTGMYRSAASTMGFSAGNATRFKISPTVVEVIGAPFKSALIGAQGGDYLGIGAGETVAEMDGNLSGEHLWLGAEGNTNIVTTPDNWATGWAGRYETHLQPQGAGELRVTSDYGYIDLGPKNATWCHIYTDRPTFYMDKPLNMGAGSTVRGALTVDGTLSVGGTADFNGNSLTNVNEISADVGGAGDPSYTFDGNLTTGMYLPGTNQLGFATNGTARLTIDSSGNVGIGTTSPAVTLHVQKDVDAFVMKVENDGDSTASDGLWVDTRWNTSTNTPFKVTSNSGAASLMTIKGDGKVGIGTASPTQPLHVNGDALISGQLNCSHLRGDETTQYFGPSTSWEMYLNTSGLYPYANAGVALGSTTRYWNGVYSSNWFRSSAATGWYNETYATGLYSTQAGWVSTYGTGNVGLITESTVLLGAPANVTTTSGSLYIRRESTYGTLVTYSSTRELKENVQSINPAESGRIIDMLRPVTYIEKYRSGPDGSFVEGIPDTTNETAEQYKLREWDIEYGFIAEELDALEPEGVKLASYDWQQVDDEGFPKPNGWKDSNITAILVAEVKELRKRLAVLEEVQ